MVTNLYIDDDGVEMFVLHTAENKCRIEVSSNKINLEVEYIYLDKVDLEVLIKQLTHIHEQMPNG